MIEMEIWYDDNIDDVIDKVRFFLDEIGVSYDCETPEDRPVVKITSPIGRTK